VNMRPHIVGAGLKPARRRLKQTNQITPQDERSNQ
jgi:hypothetical protein